MPKAKKPKANPRRFVCDNCDWGAPTDDDLSLGECDDLYMRLDPGSIVPAGQCPECQCFVYDTNPELRCDRAALNATDLYEALNALMVRLDIVRLRFAIGNECRKARAVLAKVDPENWQAGE